MKSLIFILITLLAINLDSQAQVAKGSYGTVALTNANIETVTMGMVSGTVLIQDGKIVSVGPLLQPPAGAKIIDCSGLTVYPGLIDGGTRIGLFEVGSIELTQDYREIGELTPQVQALTAVNPNSVIIPVTRTNGITTALTVPAGGLFTGTAALINLHGYTPNQMYAGFKAVVMNFPSTGRRSRFDRRSEEEMKKDVEKKLKTLNEVWEKVGEYHRLDSTFRAGGSEEPRYYPQMAALLPAYRGEAKLLVEVNAASDIEAAITWVQDQKVDAIFTGVAEGWRVADKLAAANIPVITGPVLSTPRRSSDRYDKPYANAGLMHQAGVKVALRSNETENVRNLPFEAGFAAAYGMGKEAALKAITIVPAEIFGVADQLGSIEAGKQATLFVTDGDPFEPKTQVKYLFIDGWEVPLDSRQIQLYDEFLERAPGLESSDRK